MALLDNWSITDLFCITIAANSNTPSTATAGAAQDFSVDVETSGGTIASVEANWGDGGAVGNLTAGVAPAYDGTHTWNAAGLYDVTITVTLDTGEEECLKFTIEVE